MSRRGLETLLDPGALRTVLQPIFELRPRSERRCVHSPMQIVTGRKIIQVRVPPTSAG